MICLVKNCNPRLLLYRLIQISYRMIKISRFVKPRLNKSSAMYDIRIGNNIGRVVFQEKDANIEVFAPSPKTTADLDGGGDQPDKTAVKEDLSNHTLTNICDAEDLTPIANENAVKNHVSTPPISQNDLGIDDDEFKPATESKARRSLITHSFFLFLLKV